MHKVFSDALDPKAFSFKLGKATYALVSAVFHRREYLLFRVNGNDLTEICSFTTDYGVNVQLHHQSATLFVGCSPAEFGFPWGSKLKIADRYSLTGNRVEHRGTWTKRDNTWARL